LEENRLRNLEIQPWDYKTTLDECDAFVKISMPSKEEMLDAADVLDRMGLGKFSDISDSWRKNQNQFLSAEEYELSLNESLNECELTCCVESSFRDAEDGDGPGSSDPK
jgi:hypothetical protein